MAVSRDDVLADIRRLLELQLDDWEYSGEVTEDILLLGDLGFRSLDVVILATAVQQHYGRPLPLAEFMTELEEREQQDVSVREWVDFVHQSLNDGVAPESAGE
jgi:acyl carrier protein